MSIKRFTNCLAATALSCAAVAGSVAFAQPLAGHQYLPEARVNLQAARATALGAYPGTIVAEELEKERGGSGLRYSFDVRHGAAVHEIGVDARTGAVLENSVDGPDQGPDRGPDGGPNGGPGGGGDGGPNGGPDGV